MTTNNKAYNKIIRQMDWLDKRFHENCLFLSQVDGNEKHQATVMMNLVCDNTNDDECYLAIRRLLSALAWRLDQSSNFELDFELKRKEKD